VGSVAGLDEKTERNGGAWRLGQGAGEYFNGIDGERAVGIENPDAK
jgi:hypothetical protein